MYSDTSDFKCVRGIGGVLAGLSDTGHDSLTRELCPHLKNMKVYAGVLKLI